MTEQRKPLSTPAPDSHERSDQPSLFRVSTIVYGAMAAIGLSVCHYGDQGLLQLFAVPLDPLEAGRLGLIGVLGAVLLLICSYFFEDWFASFRELKALLMRMLGPISIPMAIYLATISAIGEELLFRGAVQPYAGLVITSLLFGVLHLGRDGRISSWSVWAILAGLLIGWMYEETQSLWPCIIAHLVVNLVSILNLRRSYKSWNEQVNQREALKSHA